VANFGGPVRIGVDIGGTFTDLILLDAHGGVATRKLSTTPDDYRAAILQGVAALLEETGVDPAAAREIVHGTTVATNTILEHRGAPTGLITTRGFRDTLEIGRLRYPRLYDLTWRKPVPLVERRWRIEVAERLDARGRVVTPLDEAAVRSALTFLLAEGIRSLAVCLVHSYANPDHERRLAEIVREVAPDLPLALSSEILPEIGEYERTSTTAINAYIQPVVGRYLTDLEASLASLGVRAPVLVMQSNGGVMSARAAAVRPIQIVESGPAAGVIAAQSLGRLIDLPNAVTLDMGGTTAKSSLIEDGAPRYVSEYEVGAGLNVGNRLNRGAGYILRVPAIDIAEIGAGGGSLVWVDPAGALHVGPRSAGAVPGPLCYRSGGEEPTLTDANLLLGYLNPEVLLGGSLAIDYGYARDVFAEKVARPLRLDVAEAAFGVHRIAVANMVRVVKAVSSERGRDPRRFALIAYGGNGPVHAARVAAELGMRRIVIPPGPGLFSAFGLLVAPPAHHFGRTLLREVHALDPADLEASFREIEDNARAELAREGHDRDAIQITRAADLRYVGQSFELRIPLGPGPLDSAALADLAERFGAEHERTYGHRAASDPIEVVNIRITALARRADIPDQHLRALQSPHSPNRQPRAAYFGPAVGWREIPVLSREAVGAEKRSGPLIVEEYDATTVVPPDATIYRDHWNNLIVELAGNRETPEGSHDHSERED